MKLTSQSVTKFACANLPPALAAAQRRRYLLIRSEQLQQSHITTAGYLSGWPSTMLYLTADHAKMEDQQSALPVSIDYREDDLREHRPPTTGCENRLVRVYGFFRVLDGQKGIDHIYRIESAYESEHGIVPDKRCWSKAEGQRRSVPAAGDA